MEKEYIEKSEKQMAKWERKKKNTQKRKKEILVHYNLIFILMHNWNVKNPINMKQNI